MLLLAEEVQVSAKEEYCRRLLAYSRCSPQFPAPVSSDSDPDPDSDY